MKVELSEQEARAVVQALEDRWNVRGLPGVRLQPSESDEYWALQLRLEGALKGRDEAQERRERWVDGLMALCPDYLGRRGTWCAVAKQGKPNVAELFKRLAAAEQALGPQWREGPGAYDSSATWRGLGLLVCTAGGRGWWRATSVASPLSYGQSTQLDGVPCRCASDARLAAERWARAYLDGESHMGLPHGSASECGAP